MSGQIYILMYNIIIRSPSHPHQTEKGHYMFFNTKAPNPWDEDPEKPAKAAAVPLIELAQFCEQNDLLCQMCRCPTLSADARALAALVQNDRAVYRTHQKLLIVRLPELHGALETIGQLPAGADLKPLQQQIAIAAKEIADAVAKQTNVKRAAAIEKAQTGLEISGPGALPAPTDTPLGGLRGALGKLPLAGLSAVAGTVQDTAGKLTSTTLGYASVAALMGTHTLTSGVNLLVMPVRARAKALHAAISTGVSTAAIAGLLAAVLFPPALPFAIGYAYLQAGDRYFDALDDALTEEEQREALRKRGASEEVARALAEVRGQRVVRVENAYVMGEIDLKTNQLDGTILAGRYAGSRLSELDRATIEVLQKRAPNNETKQLLEQYLSMQTG